MSTLLFYLYCTSISNGILRLLEAFIKNIKRRLLDEFILS